MNKESKKILEKLYFKEIAKKYPSFPENAYPPLQLKDNSANSLTKSIKCFLNWSGHQAERISNMGRQIDKRKVVTDAVGFKRQIGSVQYIPGTGTNGTADISAVIWGISAKIEVKYGKDRQSEAQKEYQTSIEDAGGVYVIAKTFDGFLDSYRELLIVNFKIYITPSGTQCIIGNEKKRLVQRLDNFEVYEFTEKQVASLRLRD